MYLMAAGILFCSLLTEKDNDELLPEKLAFCHCEQNLSQEDQSIVVDADSASGAIWARFLKFWSRQKNGNQNCCEPLISLGEHLKRCLGSISAKMFTLNGSLVPEFVFARIHNKKLAQLSFANDVSTDAAVNDTENEYLPVYYARPVAKGELQEASDGIWYTMLADPKFFDLCDLVGRMPRPDKAQIFEIITETFGIPIVETQRVGSSKDKIDCGCYLEGHASLRVSCPTKEALDGDSEAELVLAQLDYEQRESLTFNVTSESHNYLFISGGAELLQLWTEHDICSTCPPLSVHMSAAYRERLLSLQSPVGLPNTQKADWSIVHAVAKAGFKTRRMCTTLVKCIRNLFVCQVNKTCPLDNKHDDMLLKDSPARLRNSLAVQRGQHVDVSALYSDRYTEQSAFKDPSCPGCGKKRSQFTAGRKQAQGFSQHLKRCQEKNK